MKNVMTIEEVKERVIKNTSEIQTKQGPKKHVDIRGWQTVGKFFERVLTIGFIEGGDGWARAYAYDGDRMVSSGFCSKKEKKPYSKADWDQFAVEGMAQTRALSRGYKHLFGYFLEDINSDLSDTPAEETGHTGSGTTFPPESEMVDLIKYHLSDETRGFAQDLNFSLEALYSLCELRGWDDKKVNSELVALRSVQ